MTVASQKKVWTDEEFMALPDDGVHYELVDGEVVNLGNSGMEHGNISAYLCGRNLVICSSQKAGSYLRFQYSLYLEIRK